ncbi:MAG: hypothetical protein K9N46_04850 [Candidatus Marinimicrobia bacterium]|nr:hypothetical protein [Candidatus Neomarinimicrobiota bacterium]MCF7829288.1 hypothetical protein [Candidatus Neomarinimicrobiota bacterium]MCF7880050.1 hypothetical protein [Candidatus Neomarinimicrobiota bacterium]
MPKRISIIVLILGLSITLVYGQQKATEPLTNVMNELAIDMYQVSQGIWHEDYQMIAEGGKAIATHPKVPQEQRREIKSVLGDQMQAFAKFDKVVHQHADSLSKAAEQENMHSVLMEYRIVQQGCTNCHTTFRDKLKKAGYRQQTAE